MPGLVLGAWDVTSKNLTYLNLVLFLSHSNWEIYMKTLYTKIFFKNFHIDWASFLLIKEQPCSVFFPPFQLHTFWVESDNYFNVTKPWFASRIPFPLSLILPGRMSKGALTRILLTRGEPPLYHLREVEAQVRSGLLGEQGCSREGTGVITDRNLFIDACLQRSSRASSIP